MNICFFIFFFQKGTLTDAGDGDGGGGGGQQITKTHKNSSYENCFTSGHFSKNVKKHLNMFIYTENDTEYDKRTKNNNL